MTAARPAWRSWRDPWKAAFFGVAAVALVVGVAWALLGSSLLVVRSVQTIGPGKISRARVLAAAGITLGTPLIRIDTTAIARRVDRITQVQSARVTRSWPDAVVIWTQRRTAVFAVPSGGSYDLMDAFGVVLRTVTTVPAGLVVMRSPGGPPGGLRGNRAVRAAGAVVKALPAWLRHRVRALRAAGAAEVTLILRSGARVVWGDASRGAAKARELAILLRTGASYYDVSDPTSAVTGASGRGSG
jgi:cell division protein FtsQ